MSAALPLSAASGANALLERLPVVLRDGLLGYLPESLRWIVSGLITIAALLAVFGLSRFNRL